MTQFKDLWKSLRWNCYSLFKFVHIHLTAAPKMIFKEWKCFSVWKFIKIIIQCHKIAQSIEKIPNLLSYVQICLLDLFDSFFAPTKSPSNNPIKIFFPVVPAFYFPGNRQNFILPSQRNHIGSLQPCGTFTKINCK